MMRSDFHNHAFQTAHALEVYSATKKLWNTPIFESDSFVVLPTVGALLEGWLLVVPRTKLLCFARLSGPLFSELENFLGEIIPVVEKSYGRVSVFEHGPSGIASSLG